MDLIKKFQNETLKRGHELQDLNLKEAIMISFLKQGNLTTKHLNSYFNSVSLIINRINNTNDELVKTLKKRNKE